MGRRRNRHTGQRKMEKVRGRKRVTFASDSKNPGAADNFQSAESDISHLLKAYVNHVS